MKATFEKKTFLFKTPSGTSRGILTEKHAWFITIEDQEITGIGECSVIPGLSPDFIDFKQYESKLREICSNIQYWSENLEKLFAFPSILCGLEQGLLDLKSGGKRIFFDSPFTRGEQTLKINGLIWMGSKEFMKQQLIEKIEDGFSCVKLKIGAINFEQELDLLHEAREYAASISKNAEKLTIRVDANGAFSPKEALQKLEKIAKFDIHSIEQPIKEGQWREMAEICKDSPIPIALDEELIESKISKNRYIGFLKSEKSTERISAKNELLTFIKPQFIILKPSLHGGFIGSTEWIRCANEQNIPWWMTSALESNLGLDAIAQFVSTYHPILPQGLGTGALYTNNIESPIRVSRGLISRKL